MKGITGCIYLKVFSQKGPNSIRGCLPTAKSICVHMTGQSGSRQNAVVLHHPFLHTSQLTFQIRWNMNTIIFNQIEITNTPAQIMANILRRKYIATIFFFLCFLFIYKQNRIQKNFTSFWHQHLLLWFESIMIQ